jgi:hypothetical protein
MKTMASKPPVALGGIAFGCLTPHARPSAQARLAK